MCTYIYYTCTCISIQVPSFSVLCVLAGHHGLVYSMSWSPAGEGELPSLASASADGLVKVWSVEGAVVESVLPHPCYVYAVSYLADSAHIVSGAYDSCLRFWSTGSDGVQVRIVYMYMGRGERECL